MFPLLSFWLSNTFNFNTLHLILSKSFLATTITVLKHVSCYYMTSFNYCGKKTRNVDLTCRCHLSNVMPDSIFYDSMGWGMTQLLLLLLLFCFLFFCFFLRGGNCCLPQHWRDGFSLMTITPVGMGKP